MVVLEINKPRKIPARGVTSDVASPVARWDRIQNNKDGTLSVIVDFYESQAVYAAGGEPFDTASYQFNTPAKLHNMIHVGLKTLPDFDRAT